MANAGHFKKGDDSRRNHGGRPKIVQEIRNLALEACPAAIRTLIEIAGDPKASKRDRSYASNSLLDRGIGKPRTVIAGDAEAPLQLAVDRQLVELLTRLAGEDDDGETETD